MRIEGKTFLVTGGGSGLGEAVVRMVVSAGGRALVLDMNADKGQALADSLGDAARFLACDVTREEDVQAAVRTALEGFGSLHGAVNCAGVGLAQKVVGRRGAHMLEPFELVLRINLVGTFNVLRLAAAAMSTQPETETGGRGVIVNTASVAAFDGQIGQIAYAASKGGVVAMTLPAARELGRYGIRVVTIAPGSFDTPMMALLSQEMRDSLAEQTPYPRRLGNPAEFAELVRHVIENEMINGETIRLDGGIRMAAK